MQALKGIVIFMGVLIVAMMVLIGYGLYQKATDPDFKFFDLTGGDGKTVSEPAPEPRIQDQPLPRPASAPRPFGTETVPMGPGDRVVSMTAAGDRLMLYVVRADGTGTVVVVDLNTGMVLGNLRLGPDQGPR